MGIPIAVVVVEPLLVETAACLVILPLHFVVRHPVVRTVFICSAVDQCSGSIVSPFVLVHPFPNRVGRAVVGFIKLKVLPLHRGHLPLAIHERSIMGNDERTFGVVGIEDACVVLPVGSVPSVSIGCLGFLGGIVRIGCACSVHPFRAIPRLFVFLCGQAAIIAVAGKGIIHPFAVRPIVSDDGLFLACACVGGGGAGRTCPSIVFPRVNGFVGFAVLDIIFLHRLGAVHPVAIGPFVFEGERGLVCGVVFIFCFGRTFPRSCFGIPRVLFVKQFFLRSIVGIPFQIAAGPSVVGSIIGGIIGVKGLIACFIIGVLVFRSRYPGA